MKERNQFLYSLFSLVLIFTILCGNFPTPAQIRIGAGTAPVVKPKPARKCASGAWTGNVTYTRTQTMTDSKTTERVSTRGRDQRDTEIRYNYAASVAVTEAPEKAGSNAGKARIEHNMTATDKTVAREQNSCDRGKTWQTMTGNFLTQTETVGKATGVQANVHVGVNTDGTYTVSVALPEIQGKTTGKETSSFSGQCKPKEGKNLTLPELAASVQGNSLTSDGSHRVDPSDPNTLSGSFTSTFQNVTETISWNLEKCGAPLRITDLQFADMKFPNWNDWREIKELDHTIDGNLVRIRAKVLNISGETKYADLKFVETFKGDRISGLRPDKPLNDQTLSVRVDANSEETVEMIWNSNGYAWFNEGGPRDVQRIRAELEENGKKIDDETKALRIAPRPLVLLHGLWSDYRVWVPTYQNLLTTMHSYAWKAYAVGEKASNGAMAMGRFGEDWFEDSIYDNADQVARYVKYAQTESNAWHVDMVGHSTGGLVARLYLHKLMPQMPDGLPQVRHMMMLGTPNNGAPCVEAFVNKFEIFKKELNAARELTDAEMANFNRYVKNTNGAKVSALAGNPVPVICGGYDWNDGFVTVESAIHGVPDYAYANDLNTGLTDTRNFGNFVLPHVITGPDGKYPRPVKSDPNDFDRWKIENGFVNFSDGNFVNAAFSAGTGALDANPQKFTGEIKLAPRASTEVEVPLESGANFGVTFLARPDVEVSLIDDRGKVVSRSTSDSELAKAMFRMVYTRNPVAKGIWKLKIENKADTEQMFLGFGWSTAKPLNKPPVAE